ncbi:hypothetical protein, partial [Verrucomicrobium spinosum]|uniref:hypothetical protein n=1 Tax=Verrucomicrobium spinosum TaxID=2736 RepID=UPI00155D96AA
RQRRRVLALGSLAAVYFLAFAAWGATLVWKSRSLDEREHRIALQRPQMQKTQAAQEQWLAVNLRWTRTPMCRRSSTAWSLSCRRKASG